MTDTMRELGDTEIESVSAGCSCGASGGCVTTTATNTASGNTYIVQTNCGGDIVGWAYFIN